ncbi:MAG: ABC transporter ATP-binding protein [Acidobacteriota bacterium]
MLAPFLWRYFRRYVAWWVAALVLLALYAGLTSMFFGLLRPLLGEVLHLDQKAIAGLSSGLVQPSNEPVAPDAAPKPANLQRGLQAAVEGAYARLKHHFAVNEQGTAVFLPVLLLILFTLRAVTDGASAYSFQRIGLGATNDIRNELFDKLLRQSSRFHSAHPSGELVSRVVNDVSMMQNAVSTGLLDLFQQSTMILALAAMLFSTNLRLALLCLVAAPLLLFPIIRFGHSLRRTGRRSQQRLAEVSTLVTEAVRGHRVVKAFGMEPFEGLRFREATRRHLRVSLRAQLLASISSPVVEVLGVAGACALLVYAGRAIRAGSLSPVQVFYFLALIGGMYNPVRRLNKINAVLQQSLAATQRVKELFDEPEEIREAPAARPLRTLQQGIRYEKVTFAYEREPVLQDLDLELRCGEMVALVGPSGAGKTTIVNLLPRFFDPTSGRLTIDGQDLREIRLADLRGLIGLVTQETVLFADTVRNNIAYGRSDLPLERVRQAAVAAYADEFIQQLPQGYDTPIGESGLRLSGGQRQRLAIARALLKNAPILILDEATSNLDTESESLVQKALLNLMQERTTLVIAHRLATVMRADRIVVLERGKVVEQGTHDELIAGGGLYRRLYDLQFRDNDLRPAEDDG